MKLIKITNVITDEQLEDLNEDFTIICCCEVAVVLYNPSDLIKLKGLGYHCHIVEV